MPRLWNETIEAHRREVREAILDATARLVAESGLRAVRMSQIAELTGIGRATLYKYFPDVEAILLAWHEREIARHLEELAGARDEAVGPKDRLRAVLKTYARIARESHGHRDAELASLLHRDEQVVHAERRLREMIRHLLAEATRGGIVRDDVDPEELASYTLHALAAARTSRSNAAAERLVDLVLGGLESAR